MIATIEDISNESPEGLLLLAAISKITTESQTDKTPDEVLGQLNDLLVKITEGAEHYEYYA